MKAAQASHPGVHQDPGLLPAADLQGPGGLGAGLDKTRTRHMLGSDACSALIKLLLDYRNVLVAHSTWSSYQHMLCTVKKYYFLGPEL